MLISNMTSEFYYCEYILGYGQLGLTMLITNDMANNLPRSLPKHQAFHKS